jgi:hypothetical protein
MGAGIFASLLLDVLFKVGLGAFADSRAPEAALIGTVVGGLFQGVVGAVLFYEGIEICRGTIPSSVGLAVGSFLSAMICAGIAIFQPAPWEVALAALVSLPAVAFLVAGVLASLGRAQYDAWWKAQSRQRAKQDGATVEQVPPQNQSLQQSGGGPSAVRDRPG